MKTRPGLFGWVAVLGFLWGVGAAKFLWASTFIYEYVPEIFAPALAVEVIAAAQDRAQTPPMLHPVARTEGKINAAVAIPIVLDGSDSFSPDDEMLTFHWSIVSAPVGSTANLPDRSQPNPQFTPDVPGEYTFGLVVRSAQAQSAQARLILTAFSDDAPPNARPGQEQFALVGTQVRLDGSQSNDPEQMPLHFQWSFATVPPQSTLTNAAHSGRQSLTPAFVPDVEGEYVLTLRVSDGTLSSEDTVRVVVSQRNIRPTAHAGPDMAVQRGQSVRLDGGKSVDPDGSPASLRFAWGFVTLPAGSKLTQADLRGVTTATPRFTPDVEGAYVLRLTVSDGKKQHGDNVLVQVDTTRPTLQFLTPKNGVTVETTTPRFTVAFSDGDSGLDLASYRLLVNGLEVTPDTVTPTGATYRPTAPLPAGDNQATAQIADRAGNVRSVTIRFTVAVFRAMAECGPTSGPVPLKVHFQSRGEFTGGVIERYRWDFDGDGGFHTDDAVAGGYFFTFFRPGTYVAVLEVTNHLGNIATDTCTIRVESGEIMVTASVSPSNGPVPLEVSFACSGDVPGGSIVQYEWDVDGDGIFDFSSSITGRTRYTYSAEGTFAAVCRVTDDRGRHAASRATATVVYARPPGSPSVTANPSREGSVPLSVMFNGSAGGGGTIVLWEWDFDGDGVFDYTSTTSPRITHQYTKPGIFAAALRATDNTGLSSIDTTEIIVGFTATLSVPNNTLAHRPVETFDNLVRLLPVTPSASSASLGYAPQRAIDGNLDTSWLTAVADLAKLYEVIFPSEVTVSQIKLRGNRQVASGHDFLRGRFELFDTDGTKLIARTIDLPAPMHDVDLAIPDQAGVRRVRFTGIADAGRNPGFAELEIWGPAPPVLIGNLARLLPVLTNVSSSDGGYGPQRAIDGKLETSWVTANGDAANLGTTPFYEMIFPIDVTVSQINLRGHRQFSSGRDISRGRFELFDAVGTLLFSRTVDLLAPERDIDLDLPDRTGVRRVRFTSVADEGNQSGFAELEILGPAPPASVGIVTTLDGTAPVSILIQDKSGTVVRRLVTKVKRAAGAYADVWDGKDDHGVLLPPGEYYAVMEYRFAGEVRRLDLTHSSGGERYNPVRNTLPKTFKPFENDLLTVNFMIPEERGASEIQAFIGTFNSRGRFLTLLDRVTLGAGIHTITWDGLDANGNFAVPPPGDTFLLGLFGFTLPANAIFVQTTPTLSNVTVAPNFFDPGTPNYLTPAQPKATITYTLDMLADVELTVTNLKTGRVLHRIIKPNIPAGIGHTIAWNGRADNGLFVDTGDYRLALRAVNSAGHPSLTRYALVRVFY